MVKLSIVKPVLTKVFRSTVPVMSSTVLRRHYHRKGPIGLASSASAEFLERAYLRLSNRLSKNSDIYVDRSELSEYGTKIESIPWEGPDALPFKEGPIDNDTPVNEAIEYDTPNERFVYEVPDVTVYDPAGLSITSDGRVLLESIGPPSLLQSGSRRELAIAKSLSRNKLDQHLYRLTTGQVTPPKLRAGGLEVACPLQPQYTNYYHWTIESLLRLDLVERYTQATGQRPMLLLPPEPPSWLLDTLSHLGYDDQWVVCTEPVFVEKLVLPSYPEPSKTGCQWLRNRALDRVETSFSGSTRVYVSRSKATERRVANEDKLTELLSSYGFEFYELENLNYAEQVQLFSNAETVLGPHGAGLCNIVYSQDVRLLELFRQERKTTFYRLCKLLGFEYNSIQGDTAGPDIKVDPSQLEHLLRNQIDL